MITRGMVWLFQEVSIKGVNLMIDTFLISLFASFTFGVVYFIITWIRIITSYGYY
jgi:hypothetical protein